MVRLTRALRPEGINWPMDDDGRPSIRLELLTQANGISHEAAHDAMSDVHATIAVAQLIRDKQPRLYEFIYANRRKDAAFRQVDLRTRDAVLHVSSKYSTERSAIAVVMPICPHPVNRNGVIVYDLNADPSWFIAADADEVAASIFTPAAELPDDVERVPLKVVHMNKCPVIAPLKTMDAAATDRLGIDLATQLQHREMILQHIDELVRKAGQVFGSRDFPATSDPDLMLYSGGFFSDADNARMETVRGTPPHELGRLQLNFDDARLPEMLMRYRARNFPDTLTEAEAEQWRRHRADFLTDPATAVRTLNQVRADIETLRNAPEMTGDQLVVLDELVSYVDTLESSLG
jgi:exodeoxyribonuclease-1